ncbi:MAG: outer membrane beta-barrel protein [Bacteroidota bacterium]
MKFVLVNTFLLTFFWHYAQNKLEISGGIDLYYGINPLDMKQENIPMYVSSNQLNSLGINLALIDFKYRPKERLRIQLTPAFGSYMNSNYASVKKQLRWIYEGSFGFLLNKKNSQWIDLGVFSSPYTFETPKSWDHLSYTRSLAPEFVPYYVTGLRYQNELSKNYKLTLFLMNGWQKIELQKKIPSLGTQLEWRKNKDYINWTTYAGNEKSDVSPNFGLRFFSELSWSHETEKFRSQACVYSGLQNIVNQGMKNCWQVNGLFDYKLDTKSDIYFRYEYFHDPNKIQIQTPSNAIGFIGHASSLGFTYKATKHLLLRLEAKTLFGKRENELFYFQKQFSNYLPLLFTNITIRF